MFRFTDTPNPNLHLGSGLMIWLNQTLNIRFGFGFEPGSKGSELDRGQSIGDVGQPSGSIVPVEYGGGFRDAANSQLVSVAPTVVPTGRKWSALGAAPGLGCCGPAPRPLASAADFSPTHFEEPRSDELPPVHQPSAVFFRRSAPPSPMVIEQDDPSPPSSPISQNPGPLLRQEASTIVHTPPSSCRSPRLFRTRDSTTAWAVAEGLWPIGEGFTAPGYMPAQLVGGVSYTSANSGTFPRNL